MKPTAILTSDWHLQEIQPICRIDNFWEVQWNKVLFIKELQEKYDCPILHAGDLFDHWKPSPMLLAKTIECLPNQFYTIYGNHDLPNHNFELKNKSGLNVLEQAKVLTIIPINHWNQPITKDDIEVFYCNAPRVMVLHTMTWKNELPFPGSNDPSALRLLKKYKDFDLILTGHNHKPFIENYKNRLLVNPGSIFRTSADQIDHKPRVYLYYAENNTVKEVFIPIEKNVISDEHLLVVKEKETRLNSFINKINENWDFSNSFQQNLEIFIQKNNVRQSVINIIYESIKK